MASQEYARKKIRQLRQIQGRLNGIAEATPRTAGSSIWWRVSAMNWAVTELCQKYGISIQDVDDEIAAYIAAQAAAAVPLKETEA